MDARLNTPSRPETITAAQLTEWLNFAGGDLITRWEELAPALSQIRQDHPAIEDGDEETAAVFTENIKMVTALHNAAADFHKEEKGPYLALGRVVDGWFNGFSEMLTNAVAPLRAALQDYAIRRDRVRLFEDRQPVRGTYGSAATVKETWGYEVDDITKVPAEFLLPNDKAIKAAMNRDPKTRVPRAVIPGIRWVKNRQLAVS